MVFFDLFDNVILFIILLLLFLGILRTAVNVEKNLNITNYR